MRATHHFLGEDDIVALRPLVAEALGGGALELWVLVGDDDVPLGFMGLDGDDISALFLEPAWRGRGGGRRLVAHAQALRGGALTVDVNEQNPAASGSTRRWGSWSSGARRSTTAGGRSRCCTCGGPRRRVDSTATARAGRTCAGAVGSPGGWQGGLQRFAVHLRDVA